MTERQSQRSPSEGPSVDGVQRVLIVDDNAVLTRGLASVFREAGYIPTVFNAGLAAIDFLNQSEQTAGFVAAIIDIHLPDINGLILSRQLRDKLGPDLPIIVLSGDGSMEVLNSLPHVGATYFFCKPVSGTILVDRVREMAG